MSQTLFDLTGSVAVVIGGTGAFGGAMADALAARERKWRSSAATRSAAGTA